MKPPKEFFAGLRPVTPRREPEYLRPPRPSRGRGGLAWGGRRRRSWSSALLEAALGYGLGVAICLAIDFWLLPMPPWLIVFGTLSGAGLACAWRMFFPRK